MGKRRRQEISYIGTMPGNRRTIRMMYKNLPRKERLEVRRMVEKAWQDKGIVAWLFHMRRF